MVSRAPRQGSAGERTSKNPRRLPGTREHAALVPPAAFSFIELAEVRALHGHCAFNPIYSNSKPYLPKQHQTPPKTKRKLSEMQRNPPELDGEEAIFHLNRGMEKSHRPLEIETPATTDGDKRRRELTEENQRLAQTKTSSITTNEFQSSVLIGRNPMWDQRWKWKDEHGRRERRGYYEDGRPHEARSFKKIFGSILFTLFSLRLVNEFTWLPSLILKLKAHFFYVF